MGVNQVKIKPTEFDERLFRQIKKMFEGKNTTFTISAEVDETGYLKASPANRTNLLENIAQEPTIFFSPEEFDKHVDNLLKRA